jgi:hypothetical protein
MLLLGPCAASPDVVYIQEEHRRRRRPASVDHSEHTVNHNTTLPRKVDKTRQKYKHESALFSALFRAQRAVLNDEDRRCGRTVRRPRGWWAHTNRQICQRSITGRRSAHLDKCSHWSRAIISPTRIRDKNFKTLATIFRPARRSSRHPSRAYPPSDDLQSWSSERQATSEPGNQNQSLAAACLLLVHCGSMRACFYCTTQYALKASFSSTDD